MQQYNQYNKYIIIIILCNFIYISGVNAATINAVSCSQADVQSAINAATDGDTVRVPAGSCTWTSPVTISNKQFTVQGAGIDQTIITDATANTWYNTPFWITGQEGKPFRISGFTFNGTSDYRGVIHIEGTCKNWRVDHCKFDNPDYISIHISGYTYGLIDHCTFIYTSGVVDGIAIQVVGDGATAWTRDLSLGTANAVFIEDCAFTFNAKYDSVLQGVAGANYVFRYNTVTNTTIDAHGADSNPNGSTYSWEIYNNTFTCSLASCYSMVYQRGGTGVVHDNTVTGNYGTGSMVLLYYRTCFNEAECCDTNKILSGANCISGSPTWGTCNVSKAGSPDYFNRCDGTSSCDGNQDATGWPCYQQPGTSKIGSDPMYEWGNTLNGGNIDFYVTSDGTCSSPSKADHIKVNRDYFNDTQKPGYKSYKYPHPLSTTSSGTQPSAPANLRIIQQ
jgi:hypothetical protein